MDVCMYVSRLKSYIFLENGPPTPCDYIVIFCNKCTGIRSNFISESQLLYVRIMPNVCLNEMVRCSCRQFRCSMHGLRHFTGHLLRRNEVTSLEFGTVC